MFRIDIKTYITILFITKSGCKGWGGGGLELKLTVRLFYEEHKLRKNRIIMFFDAFIIRLSCNRNLSIQQ